MTISNQTVPQTLPLRFGGIFVQETDTHKHLGVNIQNNCKWNYHIRSIITKCRVLVACLRSYKYRLSRKSLETMFKSFIMPHFDFSDIIWDNCTDKLAQDLENLHLDALRTIVGTVRGTSHQKLYVESGFTSLKERRRRHKIILYFKIVNGIVPLYLINRLPQLVSAINPYHRRNPLERQMPFCRTALYKSSFFPSTTSLWNDLPNEIKQLDSLSRLKRFLNSMDSEVPRYYYLSHRSTEIVLCKLRLEMSDLRHDLFKRHLSDNSSCACGSAVEDAFHFLSECPLYHQSRDQTIELLSDDVKTDVSVLLFGRRNTSTTENQEIVLAVGNVIRMSERFELN
eukprot:TRINITY_DN108977_c0_g1_i14.p1 TRINITY_DN108977_c0_g1~~TRINITY_DN108977_c0_g1_i14.p1  ORF type:complete len:341 (-),score=9.36 TRINITY_DN108977_c0_g1_i14:68-1090(-)